MVFPRNVPRGDGNEAAELTEQNWSLAEPTPAAVGWEQLATAPLQNSLCMAGKQAQDFSFRTCKRPEFVAKHNCARIARGLLCCWWEN